MKESLESPFLNEEVLAAEPHHDFAPKIPGLADESPFARISIQARTMDQVAAESETNPASWPSESEQSTSDEGEAPQAFELSLEENEFRVDRLPAKAQVQFTKTDSAAWRDAVTEAISAGFKNPKDLADLIFFMQHRDRVVSGAGKLIAKGEPGFFKLRAEWILYFTIATRILKPSTKPTVFLPARTSGNYDDFVAAPTTGRITLMVHGRNSDGSGHTKPGTGEFDGFRDELKTFDRMEETVESLGAGDSLFIANWQFVPTALLLTAEPSGSTTRTWGDLLADKAKEGVKIRVIIAQHPLFSPFMSDLAAIDAIIAPLPAGKRDNFKYIVSAHPHLLGVHHQKFIVARKGKSTVAFCGGLDISFNRAPQGQPAPRWGVGFVWHDVCVKLEGLIAHDLEREFVEHWNREKDKSTVKPLEGWKAFEKLTQDSAGGADKAAGLNKHRLQMLRTVSVGPDPSNIRRDDIWLGYFRLIGRARRFIYLENQYFHEPKLADAIVKQAESQPDLKVIVMVGTGTDDRQAVDPSATGLELAKQRAMVDATQNAFALRLEFFKRLSVAPLTPNRLRVYTLNYSGGILHSKLILVDDEALSVGSANANPRGFFFDSELNVMLDHAETVKSFRQRLWAHNLGVAPDKVAGWSVSQFFDRWDAVAKSNQDLQATPTKMVGEGVIPFKPLDPSDPRFRVGKWGPIHLPFGRSVDPTESMFELDGEAREDVTKHPEESGPWHEAHETFDETGDVAFEEESPLPRGVPNFEHFFQPVKAATDGLTWVPDGDEKKLESLNPGFVDDKDALVTSSSLQSALNDLLTGKAGNTEFAKYLSRESVRSSKAGPGDKIRVALVDLTGRKMTRPEFAGWGSPVAIDAGSATKTAALYAIFQVKTDLEHIAKADGISKTADLIKAVDERWKKAGIKDRPALSEIFNGDANPPHLAFAEDVQDAIENIVFHEANVAASLLIRKVGFPYIASLMWRSGLRHPSRGGLWLLWNFDDKRPQQWDSPVRPSPGPVFPHTATALSLATFFTLMAQGRLASKASSEEMKRRLKETWYKGILPTATFSAKVGLLHNEKCLRWEMKDGKRVCAEREVSAAHEADYIENSRFRYAVAVMTVGIPGGIDVLQKLIVELDSVIQKNNP
jgi:phosphatidylserine/phosphatidylglycerophosphate/cardiolipin synthase-like enzyme